MGTVHFELTTFFRQAPKALLGEFFERRGLLSELCVRHLRRTDAERFLAAVAALPDPERQRVEADLRDVHLVARRAGAPVMQDELTLRGLPAEAMRLGELESDYARALRLFLDHGVGEHSAFEACRMYAHARSLPVGRMHRRSGLPRALPLVDELACRRLSDAVREHFRRQGRARRCEVYVHERLNPHRFCFFAYPEDYPAAPLAFGEEGLGVEPLHPAFEVAFIWRWEEGVLEVGAPGDRQEIDRLVAAFRAAVLPGHELGNARNLRIHPLLDPAFTFATDAADGVLSVEVIGVRFTDGRRGGASVEVNRGDHEPLHLFLRRAVDLDVLYDLGLDLATVRLKVTWRGVGRRKPTTTTFQLMMPDGTDLSDDPKHQIIRRLLLRWQLAA